jgi:hypothetical protein
MRTLASIIITASLALVAADAEPVTFRGGEQLHSAQGEAQKSKVYEYKSAYAIRWSLRDVKPSTRDEPYWKPHTRENPPWVSIRVRDSVTHKIVANDMQTAWEGVLQVPQGGKHYLEVTAAGNVGWTIWGRAGVLTDNDEGIAVDATQDRATTVPAAVDVMITELGKKHSGPDLEQRIAGVKLIASRSSSVDDFIERWTAYAQTMGW